MLTSPRDQFAFAKDRSPAGYFQTIPASRLIVSQYAPLSLPEVMLPDGTLLTDFDPSEGAGTAAPCASASARSSSPWHRQCQLRHQQHRRGGRTAIPTWWPSWRPTTAVASMPTGCRCTAAPAGRHRHARRFPWQRVQPRGGPQLRSRPLRGRLCRLGAPQRRSDQCHLGLGWRQEPLHPQLLCEPQRPERLPRWSVPGAV